MAWANFASKLTQALKNKGPKQHSHHYRHTLVACYSVKGAIIFFGRGVPIYKKLASIKLHPISATKNVMTSIADTLAHLRSFILSVIVGPVVENV